MAITIAKNIGKNILSKIPKFLDGLKLNDDTRMKIQNITEM
jgi:hypothetical protein